MWKFCEEKYLMKCVFTTFQPQRRVQKKSTKIQLLITPLKGHIRCSLPCILIKAAYAYEV